VNVGHNELVLQTHQSGTRDVGGGDVYINPASFTDPRWVAQAGGPINRQIALGHELKEMGAMQANWVATGNADQPAAHAAARQFEMAIRLADAAKSILGRLSF